MRETYNVYFEEINNRLNTLLYNGDLKTMEQITLKSCIDALETLEYYVKEDLDHIENYEKYIKREKDTLKEIIDDLSVEIDKYKELTVYNIIPTDKNIGDFKYKQYLINKRKKFIARYMEITEL